MSEGHAKGSCFCGEVEYEVTGNLGIFNYCHCSRCRKFTGSVHAANFIVSMDQFTWLKGESLVGRYVPEETSHFSTAFCQKCGSSLPWYTKNGKIVVVPAGTIDGHPGIEPQQNVFCGSKAEWYISPNELPEYDELPVK